MTDEDTDEKNRTVTACPDCDSANMRRGKTGINNHADGEWGCSACGWVGDDPKRREAKQSGSLEGGSVLGRKLLNTDPDDVGGASGD